MSRRLRQVQHRLAAEVRREPGHLDVRLLAPQPRGGTSGSTRTTFPTADGGQHARTSIPFPDSWALDRQAADSLSG